MTEAGDRWVAWHGKALALVLSLGVLLRAREYLANRSLWLDESCLALNIIERSFRALVAPLDYGQAAPLGFLFGERLVVTLVGSSEYALRAMPLVAGIFALFVFWRLARQLLSPAGTLLAVAMFAISDSLIYYSAEVKQYGLDVATTVFLWWLCTTLMSRLDNGDIAAWVLVTIVGAAAIWISHPAIFVVGGIAAQMLCQAAVRRRPRLLVAGACSSGVWLVSFLALYLISLRFFSPTLADAWFGAVAPAGPAVPAGPAAPPGPAGAAGAVAFEYVAWLRDTVRFRHTVGTLAVLPLGPHVLRLVTVCAALGVVAVLWRRRDRQWAWFAAAVALACLASSLRKYPITSRLWLFLAPGMILLIAAGVDEMWRRTRQPFRVVAQLVLACLLLFYPGVAAARGAVRPPQKEEVRPLLEYVRDHYRPGDVLYVSRYAGPATRYYAARGLGFAGDVVRELVAADWRYHTERNLDALRGRDRVWVLLSHVERDADTDREKLLIQMLDRLGVRVDGKRLPGASLHLYDLSRAP